MKLLIKISGQMDWPSVALMLDHSIDRSMSSIYIAWIPLGSEISKLDLLATIICPDNHNKYPN